MAYRKKYLKRKAKKYAKKAARISVPRLRRTMMAMAEDKFFTYTQVSFAIPNAWAWQSLIIPQPGAAGPPPGGIAQGVGVNQRIGLKIWIKSITVKICIFGVNTMDVAGVMSRIVMYHNKKASGALPTTTDVFETQNVHSHRYIPKQNQLSLLHDRMDSFVVTSTNAGAVASVGPPVCFTLAYYPKKQLNYQTSSGLLASDLQTDDYGLGYLASDGTALTISWQLLVRYTDM